MSTATPSQSLASDAAHRRLRTEILAGDLAPGDAVPSERALSEELGINRHAVREALKRLQQAGLVRISQGGATRVLDWRSTGGLEILLDLMEQGDEPPVELIRSVLEMRVCVGVDAARNCAGRAATAERVEVERLTTATAAAIEADAAERSELFIAAWRAIVDGSGNLAYRLALNSLNAALDAYPRLGELLAPRDSGSVRALGAAISRRDGDEAATAARRLLEPDIELAGSDRGDWI